MAGSSVSHSESWSDTYIPEYSQTPILMEIAQHARAMSDYVYNWGMDRFNKNQGDIDSLMRDALSYASPQRIAVDMGMAEAGVQQAAERGRLSAIRDLESYGIDPSSGRYAALDAGNRVMSAAAAAGAGNQQRMASQAAGNAMRNQALAASLQNAQFGLGVGNQANAFLQTASSLKYPPLGRRSEQFSDSASVSGDSGGGSKGGDKPKEPQQPKQEQEKAGAQPKPPAAGKPAKAAPQKVAGPKKPGEKEKPEDGPEDPYERGTGTIGQPTTDPFYNPLGGDTANQPFQTAGDPTGQVSGITPEMQDPNNPYSQWGISNDPNNPLPGTAPSQGFPEPAPVAGMDQEFDPWKNAPNQTAEAPTGMDMEFDPWKDAPDRTPGPDSPVGYDPYEGNVRNASFTDDQNIDPVTGQPIETTEEGAQQDVAGSLYGLEGGDWTLEGAGPTAADWGGAETADFGAAPEGQTWDSALDTWTDEESGAQFQLGDYQDTGGELEPIDVTDTGGDTTGDFSFDYGDQGDQGEFDYGDEGQWDYDYGDEDQWDYDYGDAGDYDYGDEGQWDYDYGDEGDYDYGDEDYSYDASEDDYDYEDYADEDYSDDYEYDYEDEGDESSDDSGWGDDESVDVSEDDGDVSWGDDSSDGGDYARGGPVRRRGGRRMRPGSRPRPQTGYQPQPMGGRSPPPRPPGARFLTPPPQPPRPARGAPAMARGGPRPAPMRTGMNAMPPGNMISANGMPAPTMGGMPRPQRMAQGGPAGRAGRARGPNPEHATSGGFVSRELSPSGGSKVDDVEARLNADEFVIPKDVAMWKGKEFFYKMIAQARKMRSGEGAQNSPSGQNNSPRPQNNSPRPRTGYGAQR